MQREIERTAKYGEINDYLAVTANFDLFKLKMLPELLRHFCIDLKIGKYWAQDRVIEIAKDFIPGNFQATNSQDPMWARIILRSGAAEAGLESSTAKAVWFDEAAHPDIQRTAWEAIQRRMAIYQGRVLFSTTCYEWNWFKLEVYDKAAAGDPDFDLIQFDSTLNPNFSKDEYDRMRRVLPDWKFNLFYRGIYSKPAGMIYDCFDDSLCLIPRHPLPDSWPRYTGHDFGPVHTSALWLAQNPGTGDLIVYREYLTDSKKAAAENVMEWKKMSGMEWILRRVGGAGAGQAADEGWRQAYSLANWPIEAPWEKSVEVGIDRVYGWFKLNRIKIFSDLFTLIDEIQSYSRELDDNYIPTDKIRNKERYHELDALRSLICTFDSVDVPKHGQNERVSVMRWG